MFSLKDACAYSLEPNRLGYCGPENAFKLFSEFIEGKKIPEQEIKDALLRFNGLRAYLSFIAKENRLEQFDSKALEAYWLGNKLLENISTAKIKGFISDDLVSAGLSEKKAEEKAKLLPNDLLPSHSFHVLFINFLNPKVPAIAKNLSDCLIQWGEVLEVKPKNRLSVKGIELLSEGAELKLKEKIKTVELLYPFPVSEKDFVSVHWGKAVQVLSKEQAKNLKRFTLQNLSVLSANGLLHSSKLSK
ncbi:MAG: DUF6390 family protein [Candidatus Diapherotrites archaeon]